MLLLDHYFKVTIKAHLILLTNFKFLFREAIESNCQRF